VQSQPILFRGDGAGSVHELLDYAREGNINFSVGFDLTAEIRQQVIDRPESTWVLAVCQDSSPRVVKGEDGKLVELAHVTELSEVVDLDGWPEGSRLIARRERLQGEEQLRLFADWGQWRLEVFLTDQDGNDIPELDRRHREHAQVEDRIREGKDTGMRNLPFPEMARNQVWLELVMAAQDLIA
jgi:hypothetical protein